MSKKLIGLTLALALFVVAVPASAAGLTQSQISAILSLLQSFGAEQSVVNNVAAALGSDYGIPSPLTCASFSDVSYGNFDNSPGGRVSQLQTWLGISSSTFGFGTYGRKTQAAWDARCVGNTNPKPATLSVTPRAGNFPLTVTVQPAFYELGDNYIKFGDGAQSLVKCAEFKPNTDACVRVASISHTYTSPGTYIVKQVPTDTQKGKEEYIYAAATITVKDPDVMSAAIDQSSLMVRTDKNLARVTITGTASRVGRVTVALKTYDGVSVNVVNGRWSATFSEPLPTGTYSVQITSDEDDTVLTTGTLVVKTNTQTMDVRVNSFTALPSSVKAGELVTFAWSSNLTQNDVSQHGGGCSIEGVTKNNVALNVTWGFIEPNGQIGHIPQETAVYTLRCSSSAKDGSPVDTKQITVNVY